MTAVASPVTAFVGRERELAELRGALEQARAGRGQLMLIAGEPGIGKTRLAEQVASEAASLDMRVLWATCWEGEGAPAYWPWTQLVRAYASSREPAELGAELGAGASDIARLVPELGFAEPPAGGWDSESDQVRFRLFDSVSTLLRSAARSRPLLVVLDDLHWADVSSLQLLRFLARTLRDSAIAVVGLYRDVEIARDHHLSAMVGDVSSTRLVTLRGMSVDEVEAIVRTSTDNAQAPRVAETLQEHTGGNPFFVREVVRLLAAQGRLLGEQVPIPPTVREVLDRRLARISQECYDLLSVASVAGHEIVLEGLERVAGLSRNEVLALLDEAVAARLVVEAPQVIGPYRFSHSLVREAIYDGLGAVRRLNLHRRWGETIEERFGPQSDAHLDELAYHFVQSAASGDVRKGVLYARAAAERAMSMLAYEQAVLQYRRALQTLELDPFEPLRCELLVGLGEAQWRAGDTNVAKESFVAASELARGIGDAELGARAALGYGTGLGGQGFTFSADATLIGLLEEALRALPATGSALRVRVLARIAVELYWTDQAELRRDLSTQAVEMARRIGDPVTELVALYARHFGVMAPDTLEERSAASDEIVRLAAEVGDREMLYWGHQFRLATVMEAGDATGAENELRACFALADELRMPLYRWQMATWRAGLAVMQGRLDEAERLALDALEQGEQSEHAVFVYGAQMAIAGWLRGRTEEVLPALRSFVEQYPWVSAWRTSVVWALGEVGRVDEARAELEALAAEGFESIPRDLGWVAAIWSLSLPCALVGDAHIASMLYDMLLPYADRSVVVGGIATSFGSAASALGLFAATMGRFDDACAHFEAALERNVKEGNKAMSAIVLREWARALSLRGAPGDGERAAELAGRAIALIREMGAGGLVERALEVCALAEGRPDAAGATGNVFRRDAEYWTIAFAGSAIRIRDAKGVRDLAALLARPGRQVASADLMASTEGAPVVQEGAGEMLDAQARDEYRARLVELREDLEEAESIGDIVRAERAREEMDVLASELASALGLGGRTRRTAHPAERARKAVTMRLRAAVAKIAEMHPDLGRHLSRSVKTGTFCSYDPEEPTAWEL